MAFAWDRRATGLAVGAALLLVAGILTAVATAVPWATSEIRSSGDFGSFSSDVEYGLFEADFGGEEVSYSEDDFDEEDGIGMMRAGGIVFLIGLIVAFLAAAAMVVAIFLQGPPLGLISALAGAVGFILILVGLILFPLGLDEMHEPQETSNQGGSFEVGPLSWSVGLYLGVFGALLSLGGAAAPLWMRPAT